MLDANQNEGAAARADYANLFEADGVTATVNVAQAPAPAPIFHRMGRDPVYTPVDLDEWVASKLSGPMRSTSDMTSLASEAPGGHLQVDPSGASDNGADGCERGVSAGQPAVNAEHAASEASIDGLALHERV
jgi:hypothetical protein